MIQVFDMCSPRKMMEIVFSDFVTHFGGSRQNAAYPRWYAKRAWKEPSPIMLARAVSMDIGETGTCSE